MAFNVPQPFQNTVQDQLASQVSFQPTAINPQGFTNQNNINGIYGQSNPGTFTRSVQSPLMQSMSPSLQDQVNPIDPGLPLGVQDQMASTGMPDYSMPVAPPVNVTQQITPTYDLNNQ